MNRLIDWLWKALFYVLIQVGDRIPRKRDVPAPLRSAGPSAPEFPQATIIHRPLGQRINLKAQQAKRKRAKERRYARQLEREINALIGDVDAK